MDRRPGMSLLDERRQGLLAAVPLGENVASLVALDVLLRLVGALVDMKDGVRDSFSAASLPAALISLRFVSEVGYWPACCQVLLGIRGQG